MRVEGIRIGPVAAQQDRSVLSSAFRSIAIGAGASGAINMWYDRDIDALMTRTRGRPVPAGVSYEELIDRILKLGLQYDAPWKR